MTKFFLRRLLSSLPVVFGVLTVVFLLIHFIPGDPVDIMLGDNAQLSDREFLRAELGLDKPLGEQYLLFWKGVFTGSWGLSLSYQEEVLSLVLSRFPASLLLAIASLLVALSVSFPLGIVAALNPGSWWDRLATGTALLGMSVPIFVIAPLAVLVFSVHAGLFAVSGFSSLKDLLLPALCLGSGLSALLTRMLRSTLIDVLGEDFIRTARAKGQGETRVLIKHALKNAMLPVLTLIGNMFGGLLAGAVLTETIFDWPGIGRLFFQAFQARDFALVQGVVLWIALTYLTVNFLIDLSYSLIDPRIRWDDE